MRCSNVLIPEIAANRMPATQDNECPNYAFPCGGNKNGRIGLVFRLAMNEVDGGRSGSPMTQRDRHACGTRLSSNRCAPPSMKVGNIASRRRYVEAAIASDSVLCSDPALHLPG
jgi:hypothetical protein